MPTLSLSTGEIAYDDLGSGPVVLLLHATLHDRTDYRDVVHVLAETNRVIALDWPGHGESPSGDQPETAYGFGEVLREFVVTLDLTDVVVVGNSVGGYAACALALSDPDRVSGLVIVQGSGFVPMRRPVEAFCRLLGHPGVVRATFGVLVPAYMRPRSEHDKEIVRRVVARARTEAGSRTAASMWVSFTDPRIDLRERGARIVAPTLVTWGLKDSSFPARWGKVVAATIPGAIWFGMRTGHVVFSSDPATWLDRVVPFVAEAHSRTAPGPSLG